jgi:alpha-L-fucosidase
MKFPIVFFLFLLVLTNRHSQAQTMDEMWDNRASDKEHHNVQWFKDAKFGMFIHWGLYSKIAGEWKGKRYYGSGEWIMNQARIPVAEYQKVASTFNPVKFNGEEWAQLAEDAGMKYMVITAKHHEGFSMYDSKYTDYDIVDATPYKKDPMKDLAASTAKRDIKFGFYYSQFQDWYEPNGGRNTWDFVEANKDYKKYYQEKAVPQLKELMTNYGDLGIIWFDTPGGMTKKETADFVEDLRKYQPNTLFSSRVGHGLGDYRDFGDSEIPTKIINGPWESIYTHNDTWGYIKADMNFKTPSEIIWLLANVAAKGGNLMLNVGPDGDGNIPEYTIKYLQDAGKWIKQNEESIYGSTAGLIKEQQWGVSTSKPGKQFLHVFKRPKNGQLVIPEFDAKIAKIYSLVGKKSVKFKKQNGNLILNLPQFSSDAINTVFVIEYSGDANVKDKSNAVSSQYDKNVVESHFAKLSGKAHLKSMTFSHYFGDWKHISCAIGMSKPEDVISFDINILEAGTYRIALEYNCSKESAMQEGSLKVNGEEFLFRTLRTADFDRRAPFMFVDHKIATTTFSKPGVYTITVNPLIEGIELFKLKSLIVEPVFAK